MVQTAVTDVIGPTVTTDDPDGLLRQRIREGQQVFRFGSGDAGELLFQLGNTATLGLNALLIGLVGAEDRFHKFLADLSRQADDQLAGVLGLLVDRQTNTQAELGVVFEQRVRPSYAAPVLIEGVWRGRQV